MARSSSDSVGLREEPEEEIGQEEDEALSLCDLPVNVMKDDAEQEQEEEQTMQAKSSNQQEEFEFGRGGSRSPSVRWEMCAAEDIFYRGQILPLRLSLSSSHEKVNNIVNHGINQYPAMSRSESMDRSRFIRINSFNNSGDEKVNNIVNCGINLYPAINKIPSRSESMDRGLNSFSSRSSSSITKNSSVSSVSTGSDIATPRNANSKPKEVNQFRISHPSPKPQMARHSNPGTQFPRIRNPSSSSVWDFFKVGLVRTPELRDLNKVSRNSSSGSSNSNSKKGRKKKRLGFFERRGGAVLSGCSCTVSTVVNPIPMNHTIVKTDKQMSRHRTFEWIKELPHASDIHDSGPLPPEWRGYSK